MQESFTCDNITEPGPVASTNSSGLPFGIVAAIGAAILAAVVIATVTEPSAARIQPAITNTNTIIKYSYLFLKTKLYVPRTHKL